MSGLTLLTGGPGSGKTDRIISRLAARYEADPFYEAIVLVPTVRHGDQFRRRLVGRCGVAMRLRVETIAQFSRSLASDAKVPSHSVAEELLHRTIRHEIESGSAAYFEPVAPTRGLGNLLGRAIGDLLGEGVDPDALSEAAARSGSRSLEALGAIYREYSKGLGQENWTHPAQIGAAAAGVVREGADLPGTIMLDGFHLFRETEMDLIEALAGKADVVVTLDPDAGDRPRYDCERLRHRYPNAEVTELEGDGASSANVVTGDAADREGQLRAIARQIKQRLTDEPTLRPSDFAVAFRQVSPHLGLARQVFSEYDLPLDPAAGEPLNARPLGTWLRRLMHLARDGWHLRDVVAVLSSGFVALGRWQLSRGDVAAYARRARGSNLWAGLDALGRVVDGLRSEANGQESDPARERLRRIAAGMSAALEDLRALLEREPGTMAEHARHFDEALFGSQALVDPRSRKEPGVEVELDALRGQLRDLIHTHEVLGGGQGPFESFMARLEARFDAATVLLREPGGVLLAPMHTLHGLRFDFVAIGGLVEGEFPAPRSYHSLLDRDSIEVLNRCGLGVPPLARLSDDELWASVSSRADRVMSLWKTRLNERGRPVAASYYYDSLQPIACIEAGMSIGPEEAGSARELAIACTWQWPDQGRRRPLGESAWPIVRSAVAVEQLRRSSRNAGEYEGRLTEGLVPWLTDAEATWSASRIESYQTCAFQFFGHYALGLREIEEEQEEADPATRGTVVHEILQDAVATLVKQGRPLLPETLPEVLACLGANGRDKWNSAPREKGFGRAALWRLAGEETLEKVERLLRREAEWNARSGVTRTLGAEQEIKAPLPLDPPLLVTARIDRLDQGEDRVVIVDYKSGKPFSRSDLEEGRRVQLQLYGYAGRHRTGAGRVIARYAWLDPQAREWEIDSSLADDALLLDHVAEIAREVRDSVEAGDFRVNPKVPCPTYCSFRHVCRVNEFSRWKWD